MDLSSLLGSLGGLQSLMGGGGPRTSRVRPSPDQRDPRDGDPGTPGDDVSGLEGNDLEQAGLDRYAVQHRADVERHRQQALAAGDPHADISAADEDIMGSADRAPSWAAFFGLMRGKQMHGLGEPGFQEGRIAPGTSDVIEPMGRSYRQADFDDSPRDPRSPSGFAQGSLAERSGLSVQALRALAGK